MPQFFSFKPSPRYYETQAPPAATGRPEGRNSEQNNGERVSDRYRPSMAVGHMELPTDCHDGLSF